MPNFVCRTLILGVLGLSFVLTAQVPQRDLHLEKDDPATATRQLPTGSKRWALVIGIDRYADHQISPLLGATNDAGAVADALVRYAGFPSEQVILLATNQPEERQPTRSNIIARLATLSHLVPKDGLFLLSFAGHGIERNGHAFLMPMDARMSDDVRVLEATGIGVNMVKEWIDEMKVQQVTMFLDACRNDPSAGRSAGGGNPLSDGFRKSFNFEGRNRSVEAYAILYATAVGQRAYEYSEKKQGYFSWAIVEALRGGAANANGEVTLGSLEKYVQDKVPERIRIDLGPDKQQRPFAEVKGYKASDLVLARIDPKKMAGAGHMPALDPRLLQMEDWERVKDTPDISQLEEFVKQYPDGLFTATANDRMEQLRWESAVKSKDPAVLEAFRVRYPNTRHSEELSRALISLRPPAPVAPAAPATVGAPSAEAAIAEILARYMASYNNRDVEQLKAIWPGLGKKEQQIIGQSFRAAKSIQLELTPAGPPAVTGETALITCRRSLQMLDERGAMQKVADAMTLRLRRHASGWVIEGLQ